MFESFTVAILFGSLLFAGSLLFTKRQGTLIEMLEKYSCRVSEI
jgi:hypothetical protein